MKRSEYTPTLKEIFDANIDARLRYIPDEWKESISKYAADRRYMCLYGEGDGRCMFSDEYRRWYLLNEKAIQREAKIDTLLR